MSHVQHAPCSRSAARPFLGIAVVALCSGLIPGVATVTGVRASEEFAAGIEGLIAQLGADDFALREAASRGLAAAGMAALGPLEAAIEGDDLEVASRAAEIVRGFLAPPPLGGRLAGDDAPPDSSPGEPAPAAPRSAAEGAGDESQGGGARAPAGGAPAGGAPSRGAPAGSDEERLELAAAAEQVLCRVSERADGPLAGFAVAALDFHHRGMSQESRERLEALGAMVTEDFSPLSGQRGLHVVLTTDWRGTPDDLRLVPRLRNVVQVSVRGVRLDDTGAAALARVRGVERFELYGTGITDTAVDLLRSRFPESKIDIRKGGKLGVGGQPSIGPCMITQVVAGSAADKAGLQISDIVLSIDGQPVPNFESLTEKVGGHGPGETLVLEVQRNLPGGRAERFTSRVVLDGGD